MFYRGTRKCVQSQKRPQSRGKTDLLGSKRDPLTTGIPGASEDCPPSVEAFSAHLSSANAAAPTSCPCVCVCVCVRESVCVCVCACVCMYMSATAVAPTSCPYTWACMHVCCMYLCMLYVYAYVCIYVCVCTCMYVFYLGVCMYIHATAAALAPCS